MSENENGRAEYRLAPDQSQFSVQAFADGLLSMFGHDPVINIRDFSGTVEFDPEDPAKTSVKMEIKADSLAADESVKEKDRAEIERMMKDQVLETAKFPAIVFQSTSISPSRLRPGRYRARVIGDLTLHGTTQKNLWLQAEVTFADDKLHATGTFALKQTDYGIKLVSVAGGAMKVKNELKFTFDIVAVRQK
jgi:polyisoprenoid-binding protein YceI